MDTMQAMLTRRSVKKYKPDPVSKEVLDQIIEAGLCAPSGLNKQSPIILAVTDRQVRDELSKLNAGKDPFFRADPFYGAPAVLVVLADKSVPTYLYDGALVMENLQLAAHALGLYNNSNYIKHFSDVLSIDVRQSSAIFYFSHHFNIKASILLNRNQIRILEYL